MSISATPSPHAFRQELLQKGVAAAQQGNAAQARFLLRQVTLQDPACELAHLWLAKVVLTPDEMLACLARVLELNPKNEVASKAYAAQLVRRGAECAKAEKKPEARRYFAEALRWEPHSAIAWLWAAGVADDPYDAVRCLKRTLDLDPGNERAIKGLAAYCDVYGRFACPICETLHAEEPVRCTRCGATISLADPTAFDSRPACNAAIVEENLVRLESRSELDRLGLGLAYLNLGKVSNGLRCLKLLAAPADTDPVLRDRIRALVARKTAGGTTTTIRSNITRQTLMASG